MIFSASLDVSSVYIKQTYSSKFLIYEQIYIFRHIFWYLLQYIYSLSISKEIYIKINQAEPDITAFVSIT